jgi:hypothetical protein
VLPSSNLTEAPVAVGTVNIADDTLSTNKLPPLAASAAVADNDNATDKGPAFVLAELELAVIVKFGFILAILLLF